MKEIARCSAKRIIGQRGIDSNHITDLWHQVEICVTVTVLQFLKTIFFCVTSVTVDSFTVLENVFFKMPQRKVNVITERRIFGDDNDLPHDIRDMKSGFSGDSLLRYSSDTGSMTSVACLPLCILCFVFVKVTAYRHFTFAV